MLANPRRGWQLESRSRPVEGLITTFMAILSSWLEEELSKHRLELTPKLLANHMRVWHLLQLNMTLVNTNAWWHF